MDVRTALATILDHVDYIQGNCRVNEMVGALLPKEVINLAREALSYLDYPIPMGVGDVPHQIVKIEYLPQPKGLVTDTQQRIPVVYVEEIHVRISKKN